MFGNALRKMLLATIACFNLGSSRAIDVAVGDYSPLFSSGTRRIKSRNGGTKTGAAALKRTASKRKAIKAKSSKRK